MFSSVQPRVLLAAASLTLLGNIALAQSADIYEPRPSFGGRIWMEGGGERTRKPVPTRGQACEQTLRDMEETIALDAKSKSFSGVQQRSDCNCSYSASSKAWFCRAWYLPKNNSPTGNSR